VIDPDSDCSAPLPAALIFSADCYEFSDTTTNATYYRSSLCSAGGVWRSNVTGWPAGSTAVFALNSPDAFNAGTGAFQIYQANTASCFLRYSGRYHLNLANADPLNVGIQWSDGQVSCEAALQDCYDASVFNVFVCNGTVPSFTDILFASDCSGFTSDQLKAPYIAQFTRADACSAVNNTWTASWTQGAASMTHAVTIATDGTFSSVYRDTVGGCSLTVSGTYQYNTAGGWFDDSITFPTYTCGVASPAGCSLPIQCDEWKNGFALNFNPDCNQFQTDPQQIPLRQYLARGAPPPQPTVTPQATTVVPTVTPPDTVTHSPPTSPQPTSIRPTVKPQNPSFWINVNLSGCLTNEQVQTGLGQVGGVAADRIQIVSLVCSDNRTTVRVYVSKSGTDATIDIPSTENLAKRLAAGDGAAIGVISSSTGGKKPKGATPVWMIIMIIILVIVVVVGVGVGIYFWRKQRNEETWTMMQE